MSSIGMTRKAIGATFEGQTKEADGGVWADCVLEGEGLDPEVYGVLYIMMVHGFTRTT